MSKYCSMDLKRQSEHSGLLPDTSCFVCSILFEQHMLTFEGRQFSPDHGQIGSFIPTELNQRMAGKNDFFIWISSFGHKNCSTQAFMFRHFLPRSEQFIRLVAFVVVNPILKWKSVRCRLEPYIDKMLIFAFFALFKSTQVLAPNGTWRRFRWILFI